MSEQGNKMKESNDQMIIDALLEAREKKSGQLQQMEELAQQMGIVVPEKKNMFVGKSVESNIEIEEEKPQPVINYMDGYEYVPEEETDAETNDFDYYSDSDQNELPPHDVIALPSKGLIYGKGFKSKIAVAYLNGSDEDVITSPNFYQVGPDGDTNMVINYLLSKKILDKNINPNMLCKADRDAVIIWLRASSYGPFPVSVQSGEDRFDAEVDLGSIKSKPFNLKPNKNGLFEFTTPRTKDLIEFRFLVHKDDLEYEKMLKKTNVKLKKYTLESSKITLQQLISSDKNIDKNLKKSLEQSLSNIGDYIDSIKEPSEIVYSKSVTWRTERSIVSINGNKDRKFIHDYAINMPAGDSLMFRRYISDNQPLMDFEVSVDKPQSLGGGSMKTFLTLDHTLFLNIS